VKLFVSEAMTLTGKQDDPSPLLNVNMSRYDEMTRVSSSLSGPRSPGVGVSSTIASLIGVLLGLLDSTKLSKSGLADQD
jgi:hypothetical protein